MFEGYRVSDIDTGGATIHVRHGGSGPPLLLLHGHPQTHVMWHRIAPALAEQFTVVAPDLRGYGDSSKPPTSDTHEPYSKRVMARDQVARARFRPGLGPVGTKLFPKSTGSKRRNQRRKLQRDMCHEGRAENPRSVVVRGVKVEAEAVVVLHVHDARDDLEQDAADEQEQAQPLESAGE